MNQTVSHHNVNHENHKEELRPRGLSVVDSLPETLAVGLGMCASIFTRAKGKGYVSLQEAREFNELFYFVYSFVLGSVEPGKINQELVARIDHWFLSQSVGRFTNEAFVLTGIGLYRELVIEAQKWGIGKLFHDAPQAPYLTEDLEKHRILLEDNDPEEFTIERGDE